jgi:hypothetical protein
MADSAVGGSAEVSPAIKMEIFSSMYSLQKNLETEHMQRMDKHAETLATKHGITKGVVEQTFREAVAFFGTVQERQYVSTNPSRTARKSNSGVGVTRDELQFKQPRNKRLPDKIVHTILLLGQQGKLIPDIMQHIEETENIVLTAQRVGKILDRRSYSSVASNFRQPKTDSNTPSEVSRRSIDESSSVARAATSSGAVLYAPQPPAPSG